MGPRGDIVIPRPIAERRGTRDFRDYLPLVFGVALVGFAIATVGSALRTARTQDAPPVDAVVVSWKYVRSERWGDVGSTRLSVLVPDGSGREVRRSVHAHGEVTGLREGARTAVRADPRDPAYVELDGHPLEAPAVTPWFAAAGLVVAAAGVAHLLYPPRTDGPGREIVVVLAMLLPLLLAAGVTSVGRPDRYPLPPPVPAAR